MVRKNYAFDTKRVGVLVFVVLGMFIFLSWRAYGAITEIDAISTSLTDEEIQLMGTR